MKKRVLVLLLCVLPAFAQSKLRLTPEQAISIRHPRDLRWSPDGTHLALTVSEPSKGAERLTHIWLYSAATGDVRQFTYSAKSESHARWSNDGKTLGFLSDRDEQKQIFLISMQGGEARRLTEGKRAIQDFAWSPDGKQIAFLAPEPKSDEEEKKEKDKDDAKRVDLDDKHGWLWLVDVASGKTRPIAGKPWEFTSVQWTPAGDKLIVVATDHPESDQETNRIFSVTPADGKMLLIAAPRGPFGEVKIAPDGKQIAYIGSRVDGPQPHDFFLQPIEGGSARNLTAKSIDRPVEGYSWRADGKLIALVTEGFRNRMFATDPMGSAEPLLSPKMTIGGLEATPNSAIAFIGATATSPDELFIWDQKAAPKSVSYWNKSFEQYAIVTPEFIHFKSFDGRQIDAMILKPGNGPANVKPPGVLIIHGGPTGNWTDEFDSWGQLLVAAGYVVIYPNVRGSTGYGYDFMVSNRADWGGGDFKDVMAAADYLVSSGLADPNRLGIAGWSYGGYMSEWAITQTNRFKAAVSGAGLADLATEYGTEEHPSYDEWFYGLPYERPEGFRKSSPITYIKNAKTPTLILQGDADTIDPLSQSQMLYRALKRYGVDTELVVYPREGHGLREEKHLVDRLTRIVAWFDKHLK
jgi:dipeptidyl aminopeptidase/acylaminoacyl peptidase